MSVEQIEDLRRRALTIIWELRTTEGNVLAEAMKPYRIRRIEQTLFEFRALADQPSAAEEERRAALEAFAEIQALYRGVSGKVP
jgi:hypothetical protein